MSAILGEIEVIVKGIRMSSLVLVLVMSFELCENPLLTMGT